MAAVIDLRTGSAIATGRAPASSVPPRPSLSLIEGGRSDEAVRQRRVYLRRRLVVGALAAVVVLLGATALREVAAALTAPPSVDGVATRVHRVQSGDTLWSLAVSADPDADPRDVVDHIVRLNDQRGDVRISSADLQIGQEILVPVG